MKFQSINLFVVSMAYCMFIVGGLLIFRHYIRILQLRFLLRHRLKAMRRQTRELSPFYRYIRSVLFVSFKNPPGEHAFLIVIGAFFSFVFMMSIRYFSMLTALGIATMSSLMPILLLVMKVESIRKRGSQEGLRVVSALYRNYWAQDKNIFSAVEETVKGAADFPVCKRLLYKLLLRLRNTGSQVEIRECIDQFSFSLGTVWGKMLGVCIRLSAENGTDISEGLADIAEQLRLANGRAEERRRLNSEASRMTIFLVPMLYIGTVCVSIYYLDVDFGNLIRNQFGTAEGFIFFTTITFLFVLNLTILEFVQNRKLDY